MHHSALCQGGTQLLMETLPTRLTFLSSFLPARLSVMTRLSDSSWATICKVKAVRETCSFHSSTRQAPRAQQVLNPTIQDRRGRGGGCR
jgi:hypothetical protein